MRASHIHPLMRGIAMHAKRNSRGMKMLATALVVAAFGLGSAGYAQTQSIQFSSEADSDTGTATQTLAGLLPSQPQTWGPDDQSETTTSGSNDEPASSVTESVNGVTTYQSEDDDNSTDAGAGSDDQANASSSTGSGSALGGLVSWDNLSIQETCLPDSSVTDQIDCTTYESITNLEVNGQPAITAGSFAPGTSISVTGNIPDTNCPLGTDSFNGTLVLDNSILNNGTKQGSDIEIGLQIIGTATCETLGLVPIYTTNYNEQVGGPDIYYKSLSGPLFIVPNWHDNVKRVID
jgi:hypothetical protein